MVMQGELAVLVLAKWAEVKGFLQKSKLPELVGDILSHICHSTIAPDDDLLLARLAIVSWHLHGPTALVRTILPKSESFFLFESLEGFFPEL